MLIQKYHQYWLKFHQNLPVHMCGLFWVVTTCQATLVMNRWGYCWMTTRVGRFESKTQEVFESPHSLIWAKIFDVTTIIELSCYHAWVFPTSDFPICSMVGVQETIKGCPNSSIVCRSAKSHWSNLHPHSSTLHLWSSFTKLVGNLGRESRHTSGPGTEDTKIISGLACKGNNLKWKCSKPYETTHLWKHRLQWFSVH